MWITNPVSSSRFWTASSRPRGAVARVAARSGRAPSYETLCSRYPSFPTWNPRAQYQATFRSVGEHPRKRAEANSLFGVVISPFLRAGYQRQAGRVQDDLVHPRIGHPRFGRLETARRG